MIAGVQRNGGGLGEGGGGSWSCSCWRGDDWGGRGGEGKARGATGALVKGGGQERGGGGRLEDTQPRVAPLTGLDQGLARRGKSGSM
jgi:hypothetical protein